MAHAAATGAVIVYMDDDDYYPPDRIAHAVETLCAEPPGVVFAATGRMHIWFDALAQMYVYDAGRPNRATAATFAFRREFLDTHRYDDDAVLAEEAGFLDNWTTPIAPLDTRKTILVFAHAHNSADKMQMITNKNPHLKLVPDLTPRDFIADVDELAWYTSGIYAALALYPNGALDNKPDVKAAIDATIAAHDAKIAAQRRQYTQVAATELDGTEDAATVHRFYEAKLARKDAIIDGLMKKITWHVSRTPSADAAAADEFATTAELRAYYEARLQSETLFIAEIMKKLAKK
jgi:hypothetical protein